MQPIKAENIIEKQDETKRQKQTLNKGNLTWRPLKVKIGDEKFDNANKA